MEKITLSVVCEELNSMQCESVWCKVFVNQTDYIVVGVCYRSQEAGDTELNQLFECIKLACDMNRPIMIVGDFNYPGINWSSLKADDTGHKFLQLVLDCYLEQHVNKPTRNNHILDLILTNDLQVQDEVRILAPVDNSDHNVLILEMDCNANKTISNKTKLCYNRADFDGMRQFVRKSLDNTDTKLLSASAIWDNFNSVMQDAIKRFVPVSTTDNGKKKPLCMTCSVLRSVKKKQFMEKVEREQ